MKNESITLFDPFELKQILLNNRLAVAPMSRVSASDDGVPTDQMVDYYRDFATGGFGLIITEGTYTDNYYSKAYALQPGLTNREQADGWKKVTNVVKSSGGTIICQLMHAGALSQFLDKTIAPSSIAPLGKMMPEMDGKTGDYRTPKEMTLSDMENIKNGYVKAAVLAESAGFDGVELHAANGYLFDQFLTEYTNTRTDQYGGPVANRLRLLIEVFNAIRLQVSPSFIIGIRFSEGKVNNLSYRWPGGADTAVAVFEEIAVIKADYIHIAAEGGNWARECAYGEDRSSNQIAKRLTGSVVIANGGLHDVPTIERLLEGGHADLAAIGKAAIANPNWPQLIQQNMATVPFAPGMISPSANLDNTISYFLS